jgi:hypothetical protein
MKFQMSGTVGRATVPADTGRRGGQPYDSTRSKFFSIKLAVFCRRLGWFKISNKKYRIMIDELWMSLRFALFLTNEIERIH